MVSDTNLRSIVEQHCTTAGAFERMLSALLVGAYANGVDVSGGWEARESGAPSEWDVVITVLERRRDD